MSPGDRYPDSIPRALEPALRQAVADFPVVVLSELVKAQVNRGQEPRACFWRTSAGAEVDLIVEDAGHVIPSEAKLSSTPRPRMAGGIEAFARDFPAADKGYVVHTGDVVLPLGEHALSLPIHSR